MVYKLAFIFILAGMVVGLSQLGLADEVNQEQISAWKIETQGWTLEDHMVAAKEKEQALQSLESRVQDVEKQIANFEEKPYFDPKGFKRTALQHVVGNLKGKKDLLTERVAWHYKQADQAKLME